MTAAARLPRFVDCAGDVGELLAAAWIVVVGAGSIGLAVVQHLARAGIGALTIVDRGVLKNESVLTHPIPPQATGRPKAEYAGEVATAIATEARVGVHQGTFEDLPVDALLGADLVVLATDNLAVEIAVGQRCNNLGMPLLQASVQGNLLVAQLRTFTGGHDGDGPCPACLFGATEWQQVSSESRFACDGSSTERGRSLAPTPLAPTPLAPTPLAPTRSTASLCSLAAELAVHRLLRHLLGLGAPLKDQILEYRGYADELAATALQRNPECPVEHRRWQILGRGDARTVGHVLGLSPVDSPVGVCVDGACFVAEAVCGCGHWQSVGRFLVAGKSLGPCSRCGSPLAPSPFHTHGEIAADTPGLAGAGIPPDRAVVVRGRAGGVVMLTNRTKRRQP